MLLIFHFPVCLFLLTAAFSSQFLENTCSQKGTAGGGGGGGWGVPTVFGFCSYFIEFGLLMMHKHFLASIVDP
jgi:hypothetical protein